MNATASSPSAPANDSSRPLCPACGGGDWTDIAATHGGDYRRCGHCRYHVRQGERDRQFEQEQQHFYGQDSFCMTRLFAELQERRVRNRLRVIGRFLQQGRLLEVGPGSGEVLRRLAEKGYQVSGAEHSPELADVIRQNLGIPVKTGAFEQQRFEDTPYDGFLSFHVIEHVTDPIAHLRKAAELVRPGGFAFIATPNADSWEHRLVGGLSPNYSPVHLQLFSRESLTRMLQQTGWEVATVMTPCYTDAWLRIVSSLLRRLRGKRGGSGQLAQQSDTPFRRRAIALLSLLDLPLRMTQQQLRGGNELFVVGHRTD